jgi:hypothetical protein
MRELVRERPAVIADDVENRPTSVARTSIGRIRIVTPRSASAGSAAANG